ncbi:MAG: hypothetical protein AAF999_13915 [Pseudomonadota bacterium]
MSLEATTTLRAVAVDPDHMPALEARGTIFAMTQEAEEAVLRPKAFGAFPHALRAALAARIARLAGDTVLANHYLADAKGHDAIADPAETGATLGKHEILSFVDKVAQKPRDVTAEDIETLKAAGVSDADIVRLCELIAFLAYQIRVVGGLRLMQGQPR